MADDLNSVQHFTKAPIIEAVGISKVYHVGKQMISPVKDISLQIGYGDFVIIFGPSGAGKTTLLNTLMGVEKPDVGEVFLKGESFYDFNPEDRAKIRLKRFGVITQSPHWLEQLGLVDNVALPLVLSGTPQKDARKRACELLKLVELEEFEKLKPNELSGGQQQKASIARAMINDPWILFADEPTGHLDSQSVEEVIGILVDASKKSGKTIIMVTHDMEFLKYSKKWFFVKDGRLWDIKDHKSPFHNIKEVIGYLEKENKEEA
jgi:ABC-type lipoprotein export system ATPase subunit